MRFSTLFVAAFAALTSANTVEFINQDSLTRTVYFTAQEGLAAVNSITLVGKANATVTIPTGWIGNWYSVTEGKAVVPGMLGEVRFDGWNGLTYYDISAIVAPQDNNGVKILYPKTALTPISGCQTFPCANAYNLPDDIQTQATMEKDLVCLLGTKTAGTTRRAHARDFVTGEQ
jgi:hypothetical protein